MTGSKLILLVPAAVLDRDVGVYALTDGEFAPVVDFLAALNAFWKILRGVRNASCSIL